MQIAARYNPFVAGPFSVETQSFEAFDAARARLFPCEAWYPAGTSDARPLVVFSHHSGGSRRTATFLTTHLASHGYVVAALDHSETFVPELKAKPNETGAERAARAEGIIGSRVPDIRFLIDHLLSAPPPGLPPIATERIGIVGHSAGGWTALSAPESETRFRAVVALAPGGASNPKPGILPATLSFSWTQPPQTLFVAAEDDVFLPLSGMYELYDRAPDPKRMIVLRRADHLHFVDHVEELHEQTRNTGFPPPADWVAREMRPIGELCSGEEAHRCIRGVTLTHFDAALNDRAEARNFCNTGLAAALAENAIDAYVHPSARSHPAAQRM